MKQLCSGFMQVLGHGKALEQLRKAMTAQRLHHAWILAGPIGVGKCTLAKELARVLLDDALSPEALGQDAPVIASRAGTLLEAGTHPDLHIIRRDLAAWSDNPQLRERKQISIPIDLLRERLLGGRTADGKVHQSPAWHRPVMGRAKVFIIDEAERLDLPGQNALLKTLEEPPPATTLILVTDRPERLLPTIRSRCLLLHLAPLSDGEMMQWFETAGIPDGDRDWLTQWSNGAPGLAKRAIDHDLRQWHEMLEPMLQQLDAGTWVVDGAESMQARIEAWTDAQVKENPKASRESAGRDGAEMLLRMLGEHLRSSMAKAAQRGDVDALERQTSIVRRLADAERRLGSHLNRRHVFDALVASWAAV
jgi:hypothetical protein